MSGAEVLLVGQIASAAFGVIGGLQQASAEKKATNAAVANQQAANEIEKRQADRQRRQILGAQTAALAASGVDVNTGTALDLYQDTSEQTLLDKAIGNFNNLSRQQEIWRAGQQRVSQAQSGAFSSAGNLLTAGAGVYDRYGGSTSSNTIRWNPTYRGTDIRWNS